MSTRTLPIMNNTSSTSSVAKWESWTVLIAFALYLIWQINAILHHGSWGQDFGAHLRWVAMAAHDPADWFKHYDQVRTNPPLYHYLASLVYRLTNGANWLEVFALFCVLVNIGALCLLYKVAQQLILNPIMRIACMIFLLYLPFAMIHAVVLASDALATPVFLTLVYLFSLLLVKRSVKSYGLIILSICCVMMIGLQIKFTFICLVPASLLVFGILYKTGYLTRKAALIGMVALLYFPGLFGYLEMREYHKQVLFNFGIAQQWPNPIHSPYMNLRSLLTVKAVDQKLLLAPPYNYSEDGTSYALLTPNYYSYPALLHLGMFTDVMNFYQYNRDNNFYFGSRDAKAQKLMKISVRSGAIFTIAAVLSMIIIVFTAARRIFRQENRFWTLSAVVTVLSCAYFFNIVFFLPYIVQAYAAGYWLPRYVVPALLCFFMLMFALSDRLIVRRIPFLAWIFLALVLWQSCLHLSFLWPWGGVEVLHEGIRQPEITAL